tara:strand:+ start:287 stop:919 length:633 start_codon:yes stop_codon:yes gene_type:complete
MVGVARRLAVLRLACAVAAAQQQPPQQQQQQQQQQQRVLTSYPGQGYGFLQPGAKSLSSEDWNTYRRSEVAATARAAAPPESQLALIKMHDGQQNAHVEAGNFAAEAPPPRLDSPTGRLADPHAQDGALPSWAVASRRPFPAFFAPTLRNNVQHHMPLYAQHLHPSYEGHRVTNERAMQQYVQSQASAAANQYVDRRVQQRPMQRPFLGL